MVGKFLLSGECGLQGHCLSLEQVVGLSSGCSLGAGPGLEVAHMVWELQGLRNLTRSQPHQRASGATCLSHEGLKAVGVLHSWDKASWMKIKPQTLEVQSWSVLKQESTNKVVALLSTRALKTHLFFEAFGIHGVFRVSG